MKTRRRTISLVLGLGLLSLVTPHVAHANEVERHHEGLDQGKIVVVRGFYCGEKLR